MPAHLLRATLLSCALMTAGVTMWPSPAGATDDDSSTTQLTGPGMTPSPSPAPVTCGEGETPRDSDGDGSADVCDPAATAAPSPSPTTAPAPTEPSTSTTPTTSTTAAPSPEPTPTTVVTVAPAPVPTTPTAAAIAKAPAVRKAPTAHAPVREATVSELPAAGPSLGSLRLGLPLDFTTPLQTAEAAAGEDPATAAELTAPRSVVPAVFSYLAVAVLILGCAAVTVRVALQDLRRKPAKEAAP